MVSKFVPPRLGQLMCAAVIAFLPFAASAQLTRQGAAVVAASNIIKYVPNLSTATLAGRPDTDMVEFADGRRVRLGDVRRLEASIRTARSRHGPDVLPALRQKPAATGTRVSTPGELAAALKRGDQETVVLPSGRTATVGQLRVAQTFAAKQSGRSTANAAGRPSLTGAAIKVTAATDFKALMTKPDSTVLESPKGTRVTVGEIRQHFAQRGKSPAPR